MKKLGNMSSKPAFDPDRPWQAAQAVMDKPEFDPNQPFSTTPNGLRPINQPVDVQPPPSDFSEFSGGLGNPASIHKINAEEASSLYSPVLKYGGMAAGGAAAAPVAAGVAAGSGGLAIPAAAALEVGAGATGFALGASLSDQLDQLIGLKEAPKSVSEIASNTGGNLKEGLQTELLGRSTGAGIEAGLNLTATGAAALATKGPEALAKVSATAAKLGINLTPAELLGTKSLSAVESILDNLPWTSGIIQKYRLGEMQKLNNLRDEIISKNGSGKDIEELGIKVKNMADNYMQKLGTTNKEAMSAMKDRLLSKVGSRSSYEDLDISAKQAVAQYQQKLNQDVSSAYSGIGKKVDALVGEQGAEPVNTLAAANQIIKEQISIQPGARNNDLLRVAQSLVKDKSSVPADVLQIYQTANPQIKATMEEQFPELLNPSISKTYSDLDNNVKAFNIKKFSQVDVNSQMSNAGRQWDGLIQGMKKDMQAMAESTGDETLAKAHEVADLLYKKKLALFEDPAFKTINNKYPGAVSKTVYESGNPELIQKYQDLVGPELANKTKDRLTNDILQLNGADVLTGDQIRKNVLDLGSGATKIYTPKELDYFQKLAKAIDTSSGANNELISNPLLKRMIGKQADAAPAGIAKAIVTPNNSGAASVIENQLGADAKKKIADAFLPQFLSANQQGEFMPQTFAKQFDTYGKKTIESWYGKDLANQLEDIAIVGRKMGGAEKLAGNPSGTARSLIGFEEGRRIASGIGALATGLGGYGLGAGHAVMTLSGEGAMILGSRQLAKLYTSPMGRKLFVDGLMTAADSKQAGIIGGKIMSIIGNEYSKSKENQQ